MSVDELEQRVVALERQVKDLQRERGKTPNGQPFDWEATVEKFKNDEDVLAVLKDAMKMRQTERRAVRKKRPSKRQGKS